MPANVHRMRLIGANLGKHRVFQFSFIISVICIIGAIVLPIFLLPPETFQSRSVLLHYNVYYGVDLIGMWYRLFLLPLFGIFFLVGNLLFQSHVYKHDYVLSFIIAVTTALIEIGIFAASLFLIFINQ